MARISLLACAAVLLLACLTPLLTDGALCDSQSNVRVAIATQSSGRLITAHDQRLQYAFASALSTSIRALNDAVDAYPQASGTTRYARNSVHWYDYNNGGYSAISNVANNPTTAVSADGDFASLGVNGIGSQSPKLSAAFTRATNVAAPTTAWPITSEVKVLVIVNDGDFSVDGSNDNVAKQNEELALAKCEATKLIDAGFQIIYISSNRSTVAGVEQPLFNFASSNLQQGNGGAFAPFTNSGNNAIHYYPFTDYKELTSERILGQISAYIRSLSANRQVSASCSINGDPHFTTFDGLHFDYQGSGDYWLFRSLSAANPLSVQYRAAPCADGASCAVGAAITDGVDRFEVVIADRSGNPKNAYLTHNGRKVPLSSFQTSVTIQNKEFGNANVTVQAQGTTSYVVQIRYNAGHYLSVQRNLIVLTPAAHLFGRSTGMCGNWNNCPGDDLLDSCQRVQVLNSSDAFTASRFGDSWTVKAGESLFTTAPSQGVSHWEVSNSAVCDFRPVQLLQTPMYTRWPLLPALSKDDKAIPAISQFGSPNVDYYNAAWNNNGLVVLNPIPAVTAFQIPSACARVRGALLADCLYDSPRNGASVDSTLEILYQACTTYCKTGRLFTNLVTPSDCIAAQLCALGSTLPNLHENYLTENVLPEVTFGNANQPQTFFQPTLGLSGRYLLEVSDSDLCGVSKKVEAVDINCATETPQVVLSYPGLTTASGTQPTSTDPLVVAIVSVVPDALAGYPLVTVKADVFPANTLLGHSWKLISFPNTTTRANSSVFAPELFGSQAGKVRFQPNVAGTYVLEYAVWTGCTVSRARAVIYASCSLAPPSASIQPIPTQYTNGYTIFPWNSTWDRSDNNHVSVTWIGDQNLITPEVDVLSAVNYGTGSPAINPTLNTNAATNQAPIVARKNRWSKIKLSPVNSFDADSPKNALRYTWSVAARRIDPASPIVLIDTQVIPGTWSAAGNGQAYIQQQACDFTNTKGVTNPTVSGINAFSRSQGESVSQSSTTTVYTYAVPVSTPPVTVTNTYITGVPSAPTVTYTLLKPRQQFGASSPFPEGAVSPFSKLLNVYREVSTYTRTDTVTVETNVTTPFVQPLCRVILTQNADGTAEINFEETGDTPKSFSPVNYCKDAFYDVTLVAQDECQENSDMITLQPTCDGYVQAIVNNDQVTYYNPALNSGLGGWPTLTVDGIQSYDEEYDSNNNPTANNPYSRALVYEWSISNINLLSATQQSGLTTTAPAAGSYPFKPSPITSNSQTVTADVAGTYVVQLRVSNKCTVSTPVTTNLVFSCYNAPACDATYAAATVPVSITVNGGTAIPYTPGTTANIAVVHNSGTATAANAGLVNSVTNSYQTVTLTQSTNPASVVSTSGRTVNMKQRYRVTSAPTNSAYVNGDADRRKVTQWSPIATPLQFTPDAPGQYELTLEMTEGCNCAVVSTVVKIDAGCNPIFKDLLNVVYGTSSQTTLFQTPSDWASNRVVNPMDTIKISTYWGTANGAESAYFASGAASIVGNLTWTVDGPAGSNVPTQVTSLKSFLYTAPVLGTYTVKVTAYDGCQQLSNYTTFVVVAPTGTLDCSLAPKPDARIVNDFLANTVSAAGTNGVSSVSAAAGKYFYTWSLPRVSVGAIAGFGASNWNPWNTDIQWYVSSAPADSIYSTAWVNTTAAPSINAYTQNLYDTYNFKNNVNYQTWMWRNATSVVTTAVAAYARIPLPGFVPGTSAPGVVNSNALWDFSLNAQAWGPINNTQISNFKDLHSEVGVVLDRPGTYTFKLRYVNPLAPTVCASESTVSYTIGCSPAIPTATVAVTPAAPKLDSYKPLRVTVAATGTDADGANEKLSYAWAFISAPNAVDAALDTQAKNRNATARTGVELINPFALSNTDAKTRSNFPALFNPHQSTVNFLATAPGNYTLMLTITDGCNVNSIPVVVLVDCAGKNQYGSVAAPVLANSYAANVLASSASNSNSYVITNALTGAVPIGGSSTSRTDVTRVLNTQWKIVGFTPAFASGTTLQSSRASRNLQVSTFEQVTVFENAAGAGVAVDNSEKGLSKSSKLGLAIAFPIIGGLIIIAIVVWLVMRRSSNKVAAGGARVQQQPLESTQ